MSKDQFAELAATVVRHLPRGLRFTIAQHWIENPEELRETLLRGLTLYELSPPIDIKRDNLCLYNTKDATFIPVCSLEEMIKVAGISGEVDERITQENFPFKARPLSGLAREIRTFYFFDRPVGSRAVLDAACKCSCVSANIWEMLAWRRILVGVLYELNESEYKFIPGVTYIALGSELAFEDQIYVPCIKIDDKGCSSLSLEPFNKTWGEKCYFLFD